MLFDLHLLIGVMGAASLIICHVVTWGNPKTSSMVWVHPRKTSPLDIDYIDTLQEQQDGTLSTMVLGRGDGLHMWQRRPCKYCGRRCRISPVLLQGLGGAVESRAAIKVSVKKLLWSRRRDQRNCFIAAGPQPTPLLCEK